jgi:hypothetical protein
MGGRGSRSSRGTNAVSGLSHAETAANATAGANQQSTALERNGMTGGTAQDHADAAEAHEHAAAMNRAAGNGAQAQEHTNTAAFHRNAAATRVLSPPNGYSPASVSSDGSVVLRGPSRTASPEVTARGRAEVANRLSPLGIKVNWSSSRAGKLAPQ